MELRQTLIDIRRPEGTSIRLDATVASEGDLVFEGFDLGELPKQFFGDADYEYTLKIPAKQKDAVLLLLLAELFKENGKRFSNDAEFRVWLEEQGIPSEFSSHS